MWAVDFVSTPIHPPPPHHTQTRTHTCIKNKGKLHNRQHWYTAPSKMHSCRPPIFSFSFCVCDFIIIMIYKTPKQQFHELLALDNAIHYQKMWLCQSLPLFYSKTVHRQHKVLIASVQQQLFTPYSAQKLRKWQFAVHSTNSVNHKFYFTRVR